MTIFCQRSMSGNSPLRDATLNLRSGEYRAIKFTRILQNHFGYNPLFNPFIRGLVVVPKVWAPSQ